MSVFDEFDNGENEVNSQPVPPQTEPSGEVKKAKNKKVWKRITAGLLAVGLFFAGYAARILLIPPPLDIIALRNRPSLRGLIQCC